MAETIISPGVFTRENDISFIQPAPVVAGAAIIGPTFKGPVELPTLVTSFNDYVRKFGSSFNSGSAGAAQAGVKEYFTTLAVKNYFSQGGQTRRQEPPSVYIYIYTEATDPADERHEPARLQDPG